MSNDSKIQHDKSSLDETGDESENLELLQDIMKQRERERGGTVEEITTKAELRPAIDRDANTPSALLDNQGDNDGDVDLLKIVAHRIQQGAAQDENGGTPSILPATDLAHKTTPSANKSAGDHRIQPVPVGVPVAPPAPVDVIPGAYAVAPPEGQGNAPNRRIGDPGQETDVQTTTTITRATENQLSVARPVEDNLPRAEEFDPESQELAERRRRKCIEHTECRTILFSVGGVTLVGGIILLLVMLLVNKEDTNTVPTTPPPPAPPPPTGAPTMDMHRYILDLLPTHTISTIQQFPYSPQARAHQWLAEDDVLAWSDSMPNVSDARIVQRFALATLYYATDGPQWSKQEGWLEPGLDECLWYSDFDTACHYDESLPGVYADIVLDSNRMKGSLPTEVFLLTKLRVFALPLNEITRSIPSELGLLTNLLAFNMLQNDITGTIPWNLPSSIMMLVLANNRMTGTLPTTLGQISSLYDFNVTGNDFNGPIPSELGALQGLKKLWLSQNALTGNIPVELALLPNASQLEEFVVEGNDHSGVMPNEFCQVEVLDFDCTEDLCGCNCTCGAW